MLVSETRTQQKRSSSVYSTCESWSCWTAIFPPQQPTEYGTEKLIRSNSNKTVTSSTESRESVRLVVAWKRIFARDFKQPIRDSTQIFRHQFGTRKRVWEGEGNGEGAIEPVNSYVRLQKTLILLTRNFLKKSRRRLKSSAQHMIEHSVSDTFLVQKVARSAVTLLTKSCEVFSASKLIIIQSSYPIVVTVCDSIWRYSLDFHLKINLNNAKCKYLRLIQNITNKFPWHHNATIYKKPKLRGNLLFIKQTRSNAECKY